MTGYGALSNRAERQRSGASGRQARSVRATSGLGGWGKTAWSPRSGGPHRERGFYTARTCGNAWASGPRQNRPVVTPS